MNLDETDKSASKDDSLEAPTKKRVRLAPLSDQLEFVLATMGPDKKAAVEAALAAKEAALAAKEAALAALAAKVAAVAAALAAKEAALAEKEAALAEKNSYNIERLFDDGRNDLNVVCSSDTQSTHYSSHNPVDMEVRDFHILEKLPIVQENMSATSLFLMGAGKKKKIVYANEIELEEHIRYIVRDVIVALGVSDEVSLRYQVTQPYMESGDQKRSKSDICVMNLGGVAILVIEVKMPGDSKLSNLNVLGQVFDYMANLRNYFGQCEVFGIVTTLEKWRVVWFPDTDTFAASQNITPQRVNDLIKMFPVESTLKRMVSCSEEYDLTDRMLPNLIGTVLLKSMKAQYRVVSLISFDRAYTILKEKEWDWGTLSKNSIPSHPSIRLTLPEVVPTRLIVLRQFHGGADGHVCLSLTDDFNLVVLKRFYDTDTCYKEYEVWKNVYGVNVLLARFLGSNCLIVPFVFDCIRRDGNVDKLYFDFDLSRLARDPLCTLVDKDQPFKEWTMKFNKYDSIKPEDVLSRAVDCLAKNMRAHGDIEWRHVALLPVLDNDTTVVDMKPILIDLASVTITDTVEEAFDKMQERVNELLRVKGDNNN